ncbi:hypothetical protein Efla_006233 [Eimeria flavescens]
MGDQSLPSRFARHNNNNSSSSNRNRAGGGWPAPFPSKSRAACTVPRLAAYGVSVHLTPPLPSSRPAEAAAAAAAAAPGAAAGAENGGGFREVRGRAGLGAAQQVQICLRRQHAHRPAYEPLLESSCRTHPAGFASTLICMALTCIYTPTLKEAPPSWVYLANLVLLFLYQTLDAVDGKQARRTNTSTPLGQLFDHGCDSFSTVFAALSVLGTLRVGLSVASFMLIAILQMQLFIYTWWELHFHEYRCHTGVTGVTEGQLVMMGMNLVGLFFGSEIFTTSLGDVLLPSLQGMFPRYLLSLPIQAFLAFPFYVLLIGMLKTDVVNGCRKAENPKKAASQLLGCLLHVLMQIPLYCSTMMEEHPVLCFWTMILNTSIVALRLNLSATCRMDFSPIQWPVVPFWICCVWLYLTSPADAAFAAAWLPEMQQQQKGFGVYRQVALCGVLLWSALYLADFLVSTISLICCHFKIRCFGVGAPQAHSKERWRFLQLLPATHWADNATELRPGGRLAEAAAAAAE